MEKKAIRAAGYRRVSMREQLDGHSLDAQAQHIQEYARSQGWQVIEIYTDAGISAKKDSQRPELERLLRDAQAGQFDVVVVDRRAVVVEGRRRVEGAAVVMQHYDAELGPCRSVLLRCHALHGYHGVV